MSPILQLGPFAVSGDRLAAVAAIWLFVAVGSHRRVSGDNAPVAPLAAASGFIVARLAYVVSHWADYMAEPLATLKVWQGGFSPVAGVVAAALILGLKAQRERRLRLIGLLLAISGTWYVADRLLVTTAQSPFVIAPAGLKTLSGAAFDPAMLRGRPYVINLWADWCPPCRREMPVLAHAASNNQNVVFLFANQGDAASIAAKLPAQHGIDPATVLLDEGARFSAGYGGALPTTIFVGAGGDVRAVHAGEISRAALSDKIKLLKETRP